MRSAGCVYNDIVDQDLDRKVTRTAARPLAAKELSSTEAVVFLFILLGLGALILFLSPHLLLWQALWPLALCLSIPG